MKPKHSLIAALPLAALLIAGCGGGGGPTTSTPAAATTTTTALSKADLISQGDAICAEVNAAVGAMSADSASGVSQVSQEADLYSGMVERLKALGTPDDTSGYPEFITAADELSQAESDARLASERGDESGLAEAQANTSSALASFQTAAQAYGFEDCAEGPSAPVTTAPSEEATEEPSEAVESEEEAVEEPAPEEVEPAPETGGAGGTAEEAGGGGTAGGAEGGGVSGGGSGGIGPG